MPLSAGSAEMCSLRPEGACCLREIEISKRRIEKRLMQAAADTLP
jgi:hypothetical protein